MRVAKRRKNEEETTTLPKKPKVEKSQHTKRTTSTKDQIKILKISFEFGPIQLNTYQYVFEGLKYIWKLSGLSKLLKEPDDSFLLFADVEEDIEQRCLDLFSSIPTCTEISIENLHEELRQPKPLIVDCRHFTFLQKEISDLLSNATLDDSYLFFLLEDHSKKAEIENLNFKWQSVNILSKDKETSDTFYDICNKIVSEKVQEYIEILSKKPKTRNNSHCLKLLRKYESTIKNSINPSSVSKGVVDTVERVVEETTPEFHVIGYALFEKVLKLFAGSEIKSCSLALVKKVRDMLNESFRGRIIAQLLQKPYIMPFSGLKGGCELTIGSVSGTLGMFAKLSTENKIEKIIAISSGHIATSGNKIMAALGGKNDRKIGQCIWPETSTDASLKANIEDISVIILDDGISNSIEYRMPEFKVKLPTVDLEDLNNRKVFKFGAKTNKTYGCLKCAKKSKLLGADVMFIEPWHGEKQFSDQGDSGAIVFTQMGRELIAIGVVFGDDLTVYTTCESDEENLEDVDDAHCIAVDIKRAIDLFELAKKGEIVLDKF
ncbi:uncharacterized protein LOC133193262 [Saccostrea echinata]|uniref:uncharacterized protein LOC133193262 n=1 Tax=Saccostrea echinata TaxID=191078 RepID=UPI002A830C48|nr:uncharacterized protein LOC133193262 [Saccostrea echinata]